MDKLKTLWQLMRFLGNRKKLWLLPIVAVLAIVGLLLVFAQGSVVAPFIYPLF